MEPSIAPPSETSVSAEKSGVKETRAAKNGKEFEVYELGEVVISAENAGIKEVAIVNEITAGDIEATNSKTLAEALFHAPGVRVATGAKNAPNVSIHGFAQHRILVLIDGVPYYETRYGLLDLNQIPTENIAKIEITKGAASVLYGANALGGVINVVTRKPSDKPYARASMEFGNYESQRYSATHGMKAGIFNYWLNYTHARSNGYRLSEDFEPTPSGIGNKKGKPQFLRIVQEKGQRVNSDYISNNVWAKVGIEPTKDSEYYVNFHYLDRDKAWAPSTNSAANSIRYFPDKPAFTNFARLPNYIDWGIDLDAKQKISDKVILKAKLFYHDHTDDLASYDDETYDRKLALSTYKDYLMGVSFFADYLPVAWDTLRFSAHYKKDNHEERADNYLPFDESTSFTGSVGVENEFNFVKNLSVVAGISYDWFKVDKAESTKTKKNGDFDYKTQHPTGNTDTWNPMGGVAYTFADKTKLFGSVAKKTRFPNLGELFGGDKPNPDLKPERSLNYTLGVSRPLSTYAKAGVSAFYYDVDDMITRDTPPELKYPSYVNYDKVELYGLEVSAEIYPLDDLVLRADYTYEEARNRSEGRVTDDVTYVPRHKVNLAMQYSLPVIKTRLDFDMTYVGDLYCQLPTPSKPTNEVQKTSDYTIFDAKLTQPIWKYFEAYVACKNIFDKNYEPEVGYPAPGRSFWVGLAAKYL
ncbi:MAG: TonB-dependent receptor [Pseudomonadota bacterium]|nr:TonB-dependent receptor [Pseudomonadota bacterium]